MAVGYVWFKGRREWRGLAHAVSLGVLVCGGITEMGEESSILQGSVGGVTGSESERLS